MKSTQHALEIAEGKRFKFGANWTKFLEKIDDERIDIAKKSLQTMLEKQSLKDQSFLDVGCGSGLFSLAARMLGARVHSFDYDPQSVACAAELKRRYFPEDRDWSVEEASVLDKEYLERLEQYDVVYSWGVLHHTGEMWQALENVVPSVAEGGDLFIAIYNDQGGASKRWASVKRIYNNAGKVGKFLLASAVMLYWELRTAAIYAIRLQNPLPFKRWKLKKEYRGMSVWADVVDWVGGYPFEVARPEEIFDFYRDRGFLLKKLITMGGGHGNNEYVFKRK